MGKDTRANVTGYHTRAKLYKRIVDEKDRSRIYYNPRPIIFYAKPFSKREFGRTTLGEVFQRETTGIYLVTWDLGPGQIQTNDRVEYDGSNYSVVSFEQEKSNRQSEVSIRNECKTVMRIE